MFSIAKYRGLLCCFAATAMTLLTPSTSAHELAENRATMVLRDQNHVAITLYLNYADVLHRTLAPEQNFSEFVLAFSALPPEQFAAQLHKAQAQLQAQIKIVPGLGVEAVLKRWKWPQASRLQAQWRERTMQLLTAPTDHAHEAPQEVHVELQATSRVATLSAVFPPALGRVLVVSYRPRQVWAEVGQAAAEINFE